MTAEALLELSAAELSGRGLAEKTQYVHLKAQREFLKWLGKRGLGLSDVTQRELADWYTVLLGERSKARGTAHGPLAAGTVRQRFGAIRSLFALAKQNGLIKINPAEVLTAADLDSSRSENRGHRRRALTRGEIERFFDGLPTQSCRKEQVARDRALFELIYSSGLRVAEAAGLKIGDINFASREALLHGKGRKDRIVPINVPARDALVQWLGERITERGEWVFPAWKKASTEHETSVAMSARFRRLLRGLDMDKPDISTHSLRHSTATHLLENGASLRHVQELLGHKSMETTVRYTHLQTDKLLVVHNSFHPRCHELYAEVDKAYIRRVKKLVKTLKMP
jgi:integrase/recombinase XerC